MIKHQITIPQWLNLSADLKHQFIKTFDIPRSSGAQIMDNKVLSDGHTHEDLAHVTIEKMQAFLGSKEENFWDLLNMVLAKFNQELKQQNKRAWDKYQKDKEEIKAKKAEALADLAQKMEEIATDAEKIIRKRGRPRKATA